MKSGIRYIAIMLLFGFLGLTRFSENVRTVQVVGLFGSGACVGVSLVGIISALRSKQSKQ